MSVNEVVGRIETIQSRFLPPPPRAAAAADGFSTTLERAGRTGGVRTGYRLGAGGPAEPGAVVGSALSQLGVPYQWGGETPEGFDCSGFVRYVFAHHGVDLPRVSRDQAQAGVPVRQEEIRPGDLVFFGRPIDHVGIYAGDGQMVVAPKTGDVVKVQRVDFDSVTAIRRVLPSPAGTVPAASYPAGPLDLGALGVSGPANRPAWADRLPAAGRAWAPAIERAASAAGVDPALLASLTWAESGFNPGARSAAGAIGLTQLMPGTARGLGVDPADPTQNLAGGARYLAAQLDRFGSPDLALAAYNAGPAAVTRAGGVPPYPETQAYVSRVLARYHALTA